MTCWIYYTKRKKKAAKKEKLLFVIQVLTVCPILCHKVHQH